MEKFKILIKLLGTSVALSYLTIFIPPGNPIMRGFPVSYYIPAGSDYGDNFMMQEFLINTVLILAGIVIIYFFVKRFKNKASV